MSNQRVVDELNNLVGLSREEGVRPSADEIAWFAKRIIAAQWADVEEGLPKNNYENMLIRGDGVNLLENRNARYEYRGYFANGKFYEHENTSPRILTGVTEYMIIPKGD